LSSSPIDQLLAAIDQRDVDAVMALTAPDVQVLTMDGRGAQGTDAVRAAFDAIFSALRSSSHRITTQWHVDDAWIAEAEADYVFGDYMEMKSVPRVIIARESSDGIVDLRVYGAHERPLGEHDTGEEWGTWIRGRWIPPL
jgi:SnoaL-like domain